MPPRSGARWHAAAHALLGSRRMVAVQQLLQADRTQQQRNVRGVTPQQQRPWNPGGASASQKQDGTTTACSRRARGLCILVWPEGEKLSAEPPRSPVGADRGGDAAGGRGSRKLNEERREGSSAAALLGGGSTCLH